MTVDEFEAQRATLICAACGHVGLATRQAGPNVGPVCTACASIAPLPGVQWLRQRARTRTPIPARERDEVWRAFADRCVVCNAPGDWLDRQQIGRTVQHVVPVGEGGDAGPVVPICACCHAVATAEYDRYCRQRDLVLTLDARFRAFEARHPELRLGAS